jgi:hypothetical protein
VRFSAEAPRNALATLLLIRLASTAICPAAPTQTARIPRPDAESHCLGGCQTLYITDIHATTSKKHDAKIGPQVARRNAGDLRSLAADRGYKTKVFRDELRDNGIRPLIKHRIMNQLDHAHNARMDGDRYHQRSMSKTVLS